jgi:prolipoprotein diacylglyceryltransferase
MKNLMDYYPLALYLHIVGAMGLFAVLALEWLAVSRLRRARARDEALAWMSIMAPVRWVALISMLVVLLPGVFMAGTRWNMPGWTQAAVVGMLAMAVLGGILSARVLKAIESTLARDQDPLSAGSAERLRNPVLAHSLWSRTGLALGIVALMVFKPELMSSLVDLAAFSVVGFGFSLATTGPLSTPAARPRAS